MICLGMACPFSFLQLLCTSMRSFSFYGRTAVFIFGVAVVRRAFCSATCKCRSLLAAHFLHIFRHICCAALFAFESAICYIARFFSRCRSGTAVVRQTFCYMFAFECTILSQLIVTSAFSFSCDYTPGHGMIHVIL